MKPGLRIFTDGSVRNGMACIGVFYGKDDHRNFAGRLPPPSFFRNNLGSRNRFKQYISSGTTTTTVEKMGKLGAGPVAKEWKSSDAEIMAVGYALMDVLKAASSSSSPTSSSYPHVVPLSSSQISLTELKEVYQQKRKKSVSRIIIHCDSLTTIKVLTGKACAKRSPLLVAHVCQIVDDLRTRLGASVEFQHVRKRDRLYGNVIADRLAFSASQEFCLLVPIF